MFCCIFLVCFMFPFCGTYTWPLLLVFGSLTFSVMDYMGRLLFVFCYLFFVHILPFPPVPRSVSPPTSVQSVDGFSAKVSWMPPTGETRGLVDRYELKAYNQDHPEVPPVKAVYLANGNFTGKTVVHAVFFNKLDTFSPAGAVYPHWGHTPSFVCNKW